MAKGYLIAHVTITDPEQYPAYVEANAAAFSKYGATFRVRGGKAEVLEGESRDRHVVIEFDTYEKALECYHSEEYADAMKIRHAAALSDVIVVEGYDP
jgi:uncharacterized protein (DUF1330 family)